MSSRRPTAAILRVAALLGWAVSSGLPGDAEPVLDLATVCRVAIDRSADLRALQDQAGTAVRYLRLAFRDWLPRLSLGYRDSSNIVRGGPDAASIQWSAEIKQPLFDWGRAAGRRKLARAELEIQERAIGDKTSELLELADSVYHRVLMLERRLSEQRRTLSVADRELAIGQARLELGGLRRIDIMESELQRDSLALAIRSGEAELEDAEFDLRQLLGLPPKSAFALVDDFDPAYNGIDMPDDPRFLEALALEGNLELRKRQEELGRKLMAVTEARGWFMPIISFEGGLSLSGPRYPLQSASVQGSLVIELPAPTSPLAFSVSEGLGTGRQKSEGSSIDFSPLSEPTALAEAEALRRDYALSRRQIEELGAAMAFQVGKSVSAYRRDRDSLEVQRRDLGLRREKAVIQKRLLELGEDTLLNYVKSLIAVSEGESSLLETLLGLRRSERELERLLGLEPRSLERVCESLGRGRG